MPYASKTLNEILSPSNVHSVKSSSIPSVLMTNPDEEPVIQIDSDLRQISVPSELENIAVAGDHLSETIYFSCPRYFDGKDLSEHTCIIRFINAGNEYGESEVIDLTSDENTIKFGWAIDNYVTRYSGTIQFTVQFETEDNGIQYQWQTTPAKLTILAALDIESTITDKDDVLFRTLSNQIIALQQQVASLENQLSNLSDTPQKLQELRNDVNYLKENVVYTLTTV